MPSGNWLVASTDGCSVTVLQACLTAILFCFLLGRLLWVRNVEGYTILMEFVLERQACTAELRTGTCALRLGTFAKMFNFPLLPPSFTSKHNNTARLPIQITKGPFFVFQMNRKPSHSSHSLPYLTSNPTSPTWGSASGSLHICHIKYSILFDRMKIELDIRSASRNSEFPCYLLNIKHEAGSFTISVTTPAKKTRYCFQ